MKKSLLVVGFVVFIVSIFALFAMNGEDKYSVQEYILDDEFYLIQTNMVALEDISIDFLMDNFPNSCIQVGSERIFITEGRVSSGSGADLSNSDIAILSGEYFSSHFSSDEIVLFKTTENSLLPSSNGNFLIGSYTLNADRELESFDSWVKEDISFNEMFKLIPEGYSYEVEDLKIYIGDGFLYGTQDAAKFRVEDSVYSFLLGEMFPTFSYEGNKPIEFETEYKNLP